MCALLVGLRRVADHDPNVIPPSDAERLISRAPAEWGLLARPKRVKGVTALWPAKLPDWVTKPGPHGEVLAAVAALLRAELRPAT